MNHRSASRRAEERPLVPAVEHAWRPLQELTPTELQYDLGDLTWKDRWDAFRRQPAVQEQLQANLQRLERFWSIETGVIEGLPWNCHDVAGAWFCR